KTPPNSQTSFGLKWSGRSMRDKAVHRSARSALGSARLAPFRFDLSDDLVQRQVIQPLSALGSVIARANTELAQEALRVHNAYFSDQYLRGFLIHLGERANGCAH